VTSDNGHIDNDHDHVSYLCVPIGSEISVCQHQDFVACVKSYPVDNNLFVTGISDRLIGWDRRSPSKPIRNFKYKDRIGLVCTFISSIVANFKANSVLLELRHSFKAVPCLGLCI